MFHFLKNKFFLGSTAALVSTIVIVSCTDKQAKAKLNFVTKPAPRPEVVAKINGVEITKEQLIGEDKMDFFELQKKEYELMMEKVNALAVDRIIGPEAEKAKMSLDDFINKNVVKGAVKITDAEFKKFVKDKKIPESQINPQIKERINSYLENQKKQDMVQAYLAKQTKSNPIELYFVKPKMSVNVEVGESPVLGKKGAPVTIIEFSDFQCPFCGRAAETVHEVAKKYGNKVQVAFKHFPLPMHKEAKPASAASMCVHEQSADKFWKYHDLLFKNQDKFDDANLEKFAKDVGANMDKFKECFGSKKYEAFVQNDLAVGEKLGVKSTPTFFINGQMINGAVPFESFAEIIDEELENAKN